jgi:hypothetical protein
MGGPSPEKGPGNRRQLQIDTTQKRLKAIPFQMPTESSFAVNRTVVKNTLYQYDVTVADRMTVPLSGASLT